MCVCVCVCVCFVLTIAGSLVCVTDCRWAPGIYIDYFRLVLGDR